jgi:hypothetical protein
MKRIHVFTSSALNYFPKVELLCTSIKRYHPEWRLTWAVADRVSEHFRVELDLFDSVIPVENLDAANSAAWIFSHNIAELSTAIKPFVLLNFLDDPHVDAVLFFDPDMVLFSRLDDLIAELEDHSILLTPHQTKPETTMEAIIDNEICSLRHGVFNLGFLAIRNDDNGRAFARWWADRLYHFCYESLDQHLWTDQKWLNFAPIFFDGVGILKSPRFNVAPWNITTRNLAGSLTEGFTVDGLPLGFYHFTGFDSGAHKIMATKYGGANRAVMEIVGWYEREARRSRNQPVAKAGWAFAKFDNGEPITKIHRLVYRSRRDLQIAYPNPFVTDQLQVNGIARSYYEWFSWRAAEEYPELFPNAANNASDEPAAQRSDWELALNRKRLVTHLRISFKNRRYALLMLRRIGQVVRTAGIRGLLSKLCCYREKPI